jgi:hypothetical protein
MRFFYFSLLFLHEKAPSFERAGLWALPYIVFTVISLQLCTLFVEAVRAQHRTVAGRLERHFGFLAAIGAGHFVHLARSALGHLVGLTALGAALGLILKALLLIELLLSGSKGELLPAVLTG